MKWVDVEVGEPGKGEIRVKHHAVGLNFIDVYFRTGLYPMPLPGGLGMEAAGEVTAVGEGVTRSEERRVGKECRSLCDWSSDVCSSDLLHRRVLSYRAISHAAARWTWHGSGGRGNCGR